MASLNSTMSGNIYGIPVIKHQIMYFWYHLSSTFSKNPSIRKVVCFLQPQPYACASIAHISLSKKGRAQNIDSNIHCHYPWLIHLPAAWNAIENWSNGGRFCTVEILFTSLLISPFLSLIHFPIILTSQYTLIYTPPYIHLSAALLLVCWNPRRLWMRNM